MLQLVAYGDDSDSEKEEEIETSNENVTISSTANSSNLFQNLPQPKTKPTIAEEQDEFLMKKEASVARKATIKISIPSVADFNSDESDGEEAKKPIKPSGKKSSLFSILPPPKPIKETKTTSFVPHVLKKTQQKPKPTPVPKPTSSKVAENKRKIADSESEDEFDPVEVPETFNDEIWNQVCARNNQKHTAYNKKPRSSIAPTVTNSIEIAPEAQKPYSGLDNEAFKELVGSTKRRKEEIQVIDLHEDDVKPDKEEWLKGLTDPDVTPKPVIKNPVNNVARKKHHITYLAQQAKVNEQDLQNQWAHNKYKRKVSQIKYGF